METLLLRPRMAPTCAILLAACASALTLGCGDTFPVQGQGGGFVPDPGQNVTPASALLRFKTVYEYQVIGDYEALITKDFRFHFSAQSDSVLAARFSNGWYKADEIESTRHLFQGFVNQNGVMQSAATSISLILPQFLEGVDSTHVDSLDQYRIIDIPSLLLRIDLEDSTSVEISARHRFYFVRGDAAVLDEGQDTSRTRWYIRRWDDQSLRDTTHTSWGTLKAVYR